MTIEAIWIWLEDPENVARAVLDHPDTPKLGWAHRKYLQIIARGDADTCAYCQRPLDDTNRTVDHVVPRVRGGSNHVSNLVLACQLCNSMKADKLLHEWTTRGDTRAETRRQKNERKRANKLRARDVLSRINDGLFCNNVSAHHEAWTEVVCPICMPFPMGKNELP
jgi:5-methylcytosine-specific restriction endonuclease McrA